MATHWCNTSSPVVTTYRAVGCSRGLPATFAQPPKLPSIIMKACRWPFQACSRQAGRVPLCGALSASCPKQGRCRTTPNWNPQNVPDPQTVPSLQFTPLQAVEVQLQAISRNDEPWVNHGVQTMYEFAADAGSMERSRYFGFSKDLYHFDHFLHFKVACAALVDCQSYSILPDPPAELSDKQRQTEPGAEVFYVSVMDSRGYDGGVFEFRMVQREFGLKQGCWMTKSCIKVL